MSMNRGDVELVMKAIVVIDKFIGRYQYTGIVDLMDKELYLRLVIIAYEKLKKESKKGRKK